jgi:hypothetical protein
MKMALGGSAMSSVNNCQSCPVFRDKSETSREVLYSKLPLVSVEEIGIPIGNCQVLLAAV